MDYQSDREKVELFISCRSLKNMDVFSKSDPQVILLLKTPSNQWHEYARTEMIKDNLNPNFTKTFQLDYIFETQQHIRFDCIDIDSKTSFDFIGSVTTTLGHIVGSKNQMVVADLLDKNGKKAGKLIVRAEKVGNCRESVTMKIKAKGLADLHFFHKTSPFIRLLKISEDGLKLKVHETENYHSNLNPIFQTFELKLQKLCNGDHLRPIRLEVWDYSSDGTHKQVGELDFTIHQLVNENKKEFQLKDNTKKKNMGAIIFEQVNLVSKPEFIDYLRGGVQLSLITAIDFTGSNGVPSRPDSLHAINPSGERNQYQQAIAAVGEILLNYDYDKQVPVYGFGGKPKLPHFFSSVALHCFPCNGNPQNPEVFGLEGIENVYTQLLRNVELAGPTLFAPLIQETMKLAQVCKESGSKVYNILLILTDGEINDMDKSAAAIVDAAYLPLSIIIIGIGNADFGKMEYLDGDNGLVDSDGRKAKRDLVQFVPFNKFKGNPGKLAESVLEELPTQLCEYMRLVGIKPAPPQVIDINNMKFSTQPSLPNIPNMNPPATNAFGQNLINAGFMNNIINQEVGKQPQPDHRPSIPGNQMPIGMDSPMNPQQQGYPGMPNQFGSPQNMKPMYGQPPSPYGQPQGPYSQPQGFGGQPPQGFGGQPPQGYGQSPQGYGMPNQQQSPFNNNGPPGGPPRFGSNFMALGQNYMTGVLQQQPGYNNNNANVNNNGQAPGGNNILSPSGRYNYGN